MTAIVSTLSEREIAVQTLRQLEAYVPRDQWSRARRADNMRQVRAYLDELDAA